MPSQVSSASDAERYDILLVTSGARLDLPPTSEPAFSLHRARFCRRFEPTCCGVIPGTSFQDRQQTEPH